MTKLIHTLAILIILGTGAVLGSTAIQALAWNAPPNTPSGCLSASDSGCNPPINSGKWIQFKEGGLGIGLGKTTMRGNNYLLDVQGKVMITNLFTKTLQVSSASSGVDDNTKGKVLTAINNDGDAVWAPLP